MSGRASASGVRQLRGDKVSVTKVIARMAMGEGRSAQLSGYRSISTQEQGQDKHQTQLRVQHFPKDI